MLMYSLEHRRQVGRENAKHIIAKDPDFFKKIGSKGGKAGTGHRFAHGKVKPHEAGKLGGRPRLWYTTSAYPPVSAYAKKDWFLRFPSPFYFYVYLKKHERRPYSL